MLCQLRIGGICLRIYSAVLHRSNAAHFSLKRLYFSSPKLVTPLFACTLTSSQIQKYFLQKWHNKLTLTSVIRTWRVHTSIHRFHIDHIAPCLPPKIWHNYCLLISLEVGTTVVPRRNWKQWLCKLLGGKQGVLWSMSNGEWQVNSWRADLRHQRHVSRLRHYFPSPDYLPARWIFFRPGRFFFSFFPNAEPDPRRTSFPPALLTVAPSHCQTRSY